MCSLVEVGPSFRRLRELILRGREEGGCCSGMYEPFRWVKWPGVGALKLDENRFYCCLCL